MKLSIQSMLAVLLPVLLLHTSSGSRLRSTVSSESEYFAYDYSKQGQDWVMGTCASRNRQSPIDLPAEHYSQPTGTLSFLYDQVMDPIDLLNNGHTYSADLTGQGIGGITYGGTWYNLMSINIHAVSEHTFGGRHTPLEFHLVHKRHDGDALLVAAVPFDNPLAAAMAAQGVPPPPPAPVSNAPGTPYVPPVPTEPYFNPVLNAFLKSQLPPVNTKGTMPIDKWDPFDVNAFLQGGTFYEYAGSMTAPPCAETVVWLVRREVLPASASQISLLRDSIFGMTAAFGNNRAAMPVGSRSVFVRRAVKEEPPPPAPPLSSVTSAGGGVAGLHVDKEYHSMKWAKDALRIAAASADYVKDLDMRLRNAAQAHYDALDPAAGTTLPPFGLLAGTTTPPMGDAEAMAQNLAMSIKKVAKEAIQDASKEIAATAQAAAVAAAQAAVKAAAQDIIPAPAPAVPPPGTPPIGVPGR